LAVELANAGFFRLLLPGWLNGPQLDPATFVRVVEQLAGIDASTAWVVCQTSGCSMIAAYLPRDLAKMMFGPADGVLAWGPPVAATAHAVPGGWDVSGTWGFLSGCHHATWVGGACLAASLDGASEEERTFLCPINEVQLLDRWRVLGLRGTGSDSFSLASAFVPAERAPRRDHPADRTDASSLYRFHTTQLFSAGFAGVALGIARALLNDLLAVATAKQPRGARSTLRDDAAFQLQLGRWEARLRAARALLLTTIDDVWQVVSMTNEELTPRQRVDIRLAASHASAEARDVGTAAFHAAGSSAIFTTQGAERRLRDLLTLGQQVQARDDHFQTAGRSLLGLPTNSPFV
ncbi:MAG: acyl-CoA dehydrogenase family protein, partial [Chloroflexota bacterium]